MGVSKGAQSARGKDVFKVTAGGQSRKRKKEKGKEGRMVGSQRSPSVWSLHPQCSHQFWCLISSVCQPRLLRALIPPCPSWPGLRVGVCVPPAVPRGAAIPALLPLADWHSCCALLVLPAKAVEIWLLPSVRAGGAPAGCKLWPKS